MLLGTSIDINHPPTPYELDNCGFSMVRMVATHYKKHIRIAQRYILDNIDIALVLTPAALSTPDKWFAETQSLIKLWRPSYLIVGNEADGAPTEEGASWIQSPFDFQHLLDVVQSARVEPYPEFVVGGLVSGQPTYLDNLTIPHYNALDIHPYAKTPSAAYDMLQEYAVYLDPHLNQYLTVGEFHTDPSNLWSFLNAMASADVYLAHWFHWSYGEFSLTPEHKAIFKEWSNAR